MSPNNYIFQNNFHSAHQKSIALAANIGVDKKAPGSQQDERGQIQGAGASPTGHRRNSSKTTAGIVSHRMSPAGLADDLQSHLFGLRRGAQSGRIRMHCMPPQRYCRASTVTKMSAELGGVQAAEASLPVPLISATRGLPPARVERRNECQSIKNLRIHLEFSMFRVRTRTGGPLSSAIHVPFSSVIRGSKLV